MGYQTEHSTIDPELRRRLVQHVLTDLAALEQMIAAGRFETGVRRIGAEQELVFVDQHWQPAPVGAQVLERLSDDMFTTELSLFNLEFNLPPLIYRGDCLSRLEQNFHAALDRVRSTAAELGARPILTGILPTLREADLDLKNITPRPRYIALVQALRELRGADYEFRFTGTDELIMRHESVMFEACNTSTQFHFQVSPSEFARYFNIAQAVAGPVLAAAVNSPLLFGHRLWKETRIALFQQSIDTRRPLHAHEHRSARVRFGEGWVHDSVTELFREDVSRFRVLLAETVEEDPFEVLAQGRAPKLKALQLHNGTVYRWNRACYGVTEGKPHLRIENRVFPAGPTILDEVANAAFWFGLLVGVEAEYGDVAAIMEFDDAKDNFLYAARLGLAAPLTWVDGRAMPAAKLIEQVLLPLARGGLRRSGIDDDDADRYLGVIAGRVQSGQTGAQWALESLRHLQHDQTRYQSLDTLVAATWTRQQENTPVHEWSIAGSGESGAPTGRYRRVEQFMTSDVFSVRQDDAIDLAANLMDWKHIRHVPVEDKEHRLVGLISYRQLLRFLVTNRLQGSEPVVTAGDIMQRNPVTVAPETPTLEAIAIMRERKIPCLPVVRDQRLLGILTDRDFITIAAQLLEARLAAE